MLPPKSDRWIKTVSSSSAYPAELSTKSMASDLSYASTTTLDGLPLPARWLLAVDESDLKVMVMRPDMYVTLDGFSVKPIVITYCRKEDE